MASSLSERDFKTDGDGLLTFDLITGREWLDPIHTKDLDANELYYALTDGGAYAGFTHATAKEVEELISHSGVDMSVVGLVDGMKSEVPFTMTADGEYGPVSGPRSFYGYTTAGPTRTLRDMSALFQLLDQPIDHQLPPSYSTHDLYGRSIDGSNYVFNANYFDALPSTMVIIRVRTDLSTRPFLYRDAEEASTLYSTSGDDTLDGFSGYDIIDGKGGLDTAKYSVASTEVSFSENDAGQLMLSEYHTWDWWFWSTSLQRLAVKSEIFISIERIQFSDKNYALDLDGKAGVAAKAIITSFGAEKLNTLMSPALSLVDGGSTLTQLCDLIVQNSYIENLIGSSTNGSFVDHVYENVVGVAPSSAAHDKYAALLDNGTYTKSSLLALAANTTLTEALVTANSVDLIGVPGSADGEILALQYDLGLG
jgi:hypothetical protein